MASEYISRVFNDQGEYEIVFKTTNKKHYNYIESCCREVTDHLKPFENTKCCYNCCFSNYYDKNNRDLYCIAIKNPIKVDYNHCCADWRIK